MRMAVRWVKVRELEEAFGERHPDFVHAFKCVAAAFLGEKKPERDGYVDPPV